MSLPFHSNANNDGSINFHGNASHYNGTNEKHGHTLVMSVMKKLHAKISRHG